MGNATRGGGKRLFLTVVLLANSTCMSACGWIQDQIAEPAAVHVAVGENTRGQRETLPGDAPTFDLNRDCMPAHLERRA